MHKKRFAAKGLIALLILIAISFYFSQTIQNIFTPKVNIIRPNIDKFKKTTTLRCFLAHIKLPTQRMKYTLPNEIKIRKYFVDEGDFVKKGDVICEFQYDIPMNLHKELYGRQEQILKKSMDIAKLEKQVKYTEKEKAYYAAHFNLTKAVVNQNWFYNKFNAINDKKYKLSLKNYPPNSTSEMRNLVDNWRKAFLERQKAEKEYDAFPSKMRIKYAVDNFFSTYYANQLDIHELNLEMEDYWYKKQHVMQLLAPCDAYISILQGAEESQLYYDSTILQYIPCKSPKELMVLRAYLHSNMKPPKKGDTVNLKTSIGNFKGNIVKSGLDPEGKACIDIELPDELLKKVPTRIIEKMNIEADSTYISDIAYNLIPINCVHFEAKLPYVYIINESGDSNDIQMNIRRTPVTIIDNVGGIVAIKENLGNVQLAYMEDRPLTDGAKVISY